MLIPEQILQEMTLEEVSEQIEEMRVKLVQLGMDKGFQDPKVLFISRQLDKLLNQYYLIDK